METITSFLIEHYNIGGSLLALAGIAITVRIGKYFIFKLAPLKQAREENRERDREKLAMEKYKPVIKAGRKVGLGTNLVFFLLLLPFFVTLESQPIWTMLLDIFIILMFYDFFYYLSHRFWFHGNGWMRKVHAVHHQARKPTYIDSHYVHPFETFVGLALYVGSITVLAPFLGPYHVVTIILTFTIFTQLNIINHTRVEIDRFPYKTLTWITRKHHIHHIDMHKGNYATITLLYDKLFGTLD